MNQNNPLKIIKTDQSSSEGLKHSSRSDRKQEQEARLERRWLLKGNKCTRHEALEKQRIRRTLLLINDCTTLKDKKVVDVGAGVGAISRLMRDAGAHVTAIDLSSNALKIFEKHGSDNIQLVKDGLPTTKFEDDSFDVVVCADVIADVHPEDRRLAMAELSRIVKKDGWVICSTGIDIHSEDALERFEGLFQTEFMIKKSFESYNAYYIRLFHFLEAPRRFFQGWRSQEYRKEHLQERRGLSQSWYRLNSSQAIALIWAIPSWVLSPCVELLKRSNLLLKGLEYLCKTISNEAGVSYSILGGQRKPLFEAKTEKFEGDRSPFIRDRKWE